jgi:hypothetical protein
MQAHHHQDAPSSSIRRSANQEAVVRDAVNVRAERGNAISHIAHIVERVGLAMAGTLCGLFVAACVIRGVSGALDTTGFVMGMCLIGMIGFYLGIDIPQARSGAFRIVDKGIEPQVNPVELLSACGTFLTAMAALLAVYVIISDQIPQLTLTVVVGCPWLLGAIMQIGAGAIARLRSTHRVG